MFNHEIHERHERRRAEGGDRRNCPRITRREAKGAGLALDRRLGNTALLVASRLPARRAAAAIDETIDRLAAAAQRSLDERSLDQRSGESDIWAS